MPDGQLLVETDAPFLTPHPHRGQANEPYCLPWTVRGLAELRGVTDERLAADARRTAERVFRLAELPVTGSPVMPGPARGSFGVAERPLGAPVHHESASTFTRRYGREDR